MGALAKRSSETVRNHRNAVRDGQESASRRCHDRECDGHGAPCLPQREALALGLNGNALDRSRHAGSSQRLPTTEGSQATSCVTGRSGSEPRQKLTWRSCSPGQRRVTSTMTTTASQCSTKSRDIQSYEDGFSLQDKQFDDLFVRDEITRSWTNESDALVVKNVSQNKYGDVRHDLTSGYTIRLFPAGCESEAWRFFAPGSDHHIVFPRERGI